MALYAQTRADIRLWIAKIIFVFYTLLVACTRLYKPLRRSVGRSVGRSVRRSLFTKHATYGDRPRWNFAHQKKRIFLLGTQTLRISLLSQKVCIVETLPRTPKVYRPHLSGQTVLKALSLNPCHFQTLNRIAFKNAPINSNFKIVFKNGVTCQICN